MKMIENSGQESVINNPAVPNEHNQGVMTEAGTSIIDSIKGMMANGQADQVAQLASNPTGPAAQLLQNDFVKNIMNKFGISPEAAQNIASNLLPQVMAQVSKASSNGSLDLGAIGGMLGKTGLDKDGDGDVDLKDITNMLGF